MESFISQSNLIFLSQYAFNTTCNSQYGKCHLEKHGQAFYLIWGIYWPEKGFDTVDDKIIWHKLDDYGFRGVTNKWFSSYLQGRTKKTQIDSYTVYLKEKKYYLRYK